MALIPDDWKGKNLDVRNLFILSAAAALHDLGKASDTKDDHGFVSMTELRTRAQDFGLDDTEAEVIGWVVRPHNDGDIERLPQQPVPIGAAEVNVRQLAALFKVADALHTDSSRVSRQVTAMRGRKPEEDPKTLFRMRIRGWRFDEQDRIELYGVPKDWNETEILSRGVELTRRELETAAPILRQMGIPSEIVLRVDDTDLRDKATTTIREQRKLNRAWLGLDYFLEEDAPRFKGRKSDADALWTSVMGSPIWLLIGDSGVGKTSLIHAGLMPHLHQMGWQTVYARPFDQPDHHIITALSDEVLKGKPKEKDSVVDVLSEAAQAIGGRTMLLILDQFEDVLRLGSNVALEGIRQTLVAVQAGRFRNVHVLVSYRSDAEASLGQLFQQITGSNRGAPKSYLVPLNVAGAREAFEIGFATAQIGTSKELLNAICRDLETETFGRGIYPPYVQMLGETLTGVARQKGGGILTEALYASEGSAKQIIGQYLFRQLEGFSLNAQVAQQVLVALVRSTGTKGQRSVEELKAETRVSNEMLTVVLGKLVDGRMVRHLAGQQYEIAHDYLAQLVDRNIVSDDQRSLMVVRELLEMKARAYATDRALLHSEEMAQLYVWRESIIPSHEQMRLILHSYLAGKGPAWVWLRHLDKPTLISLLRDGAKHELPIVRLRTAKLLGCLIGHQAMSDLRSYLHDKSPQVQAAAAMELIRVAGPQDASDLMSLLRLCGRCAHHNYNQEIVTYALSYLAAPQDIPAINIILKNPSSTIRQAAATVLAYVVGRKDISQLRRLLKDKNRAIRLSALPVLANLAGRRAILDLKVSLKDTCPDVRCIALECLVRVAGRQGIPELIALSKDPDQHVRMVARSTLLKVAERQDIPVLLKLESNYRGWEFEEKLKQVASREDIPNLLKKKSAVVRMAAVNALARLDGRQAIPVFKALLKDRDDRVVSEAKKALLSVAGREDVPLLLDWIESQFYYIWSVLEAFARVAGRQDISCILKDKGSEIKKALLQILTTVVNQEATSDLKVLLKDPDRQIRRLAVAALGIVAKPQDIPDIKTMLQDRSQQVRDAAVESLASAIKCLGIVDLKDFLKDPNRSIRCAAAIAFAHAAGREDMSELLLAFGDPDDTIRRVVSQKLFLISETGDLTAIAQKVVRCAATGIGEEGMQLLILLDRKFYNPFEQQADEYESRHYFGIDLLSRSD